MGHEGTQETAPETLQTPLRLLIPSPIKALQELLKKIAL